MGLTAHAEAGQLRCIAAETCNKKKPDVGQAPVSHLLVQLRPSLPVQCRVTTL
jgi:hypothetical protein